MSKRPHSLLAYKQISIQEPSESSAIKVPKLVHDDESKQKVLLCQENTDKSSDLTSNEINSVKSQKNLDSNDNNEPNSENKSTNPQPREKNNESDTPKIDSFLSLENLLPQDWRDALSAEFSKPYWKSLVTSLQKEKDAKEKIFPPIDLIFTAFRACPLNDIKVVIIGQDPYHDDDQAMGLSFSVPQTLRKLPPSLKNIYKELSTDIAGYKAPAHGDLTSWANQGVFLLNTVLTVRAHQANSHAKLGWIQFTDAVVKVLSTKKNIVWMLWGKPAEKKASIVNKSQNCILVSVHPSPLSASRGWFGSGHFSKANAYLKSIEKEPIQWQN